MAVKTPATIKISARLKIGQNFKSIKSITEPFNILSIKFPRPPPRIIAKENIAMRPRFVSLVKKYKTARRSATVRIIKTILGITIPKAIPSLNEVGQNFGARNFESWSRAAKKTTRTDSFRMVFFIFNFKAQGKQNVILFPLLYNVWEIV